jgi:hypothetical protein
MKPFTSRLLLILLAAWLFSAAPLVAQTTNVDRAEILWAGTYNAQIVGTVSQPETAAGKTNRLGQVQKLESTTTIRGRLGTNFGFEYALSGTLAGAHAAIEIMVLLPEPGLLNPETGKRTLRERWQPSPSLVGGATVVGYQSERDWVILPGLWKFEIWHNGRKLGEQSFCVLAEPSPAEGNGDKKKDPCHSAATA